MKEKVIICISTISILLLISGIVFVNYFHYNDYKDLFKIVNSKINDNASKNVSLSEYMYDYKHEELGISEKELSYITTASDSTSFSDGNDLITLNKSDAISDIEFLFNLFKYSYAGYSYFGGDDIFRRAQKSIVESINMYPGETIDSNKLEMLIIKNTEFIQDGHFQINCKSPLKKYTYYSNEDICVKKSRNEYYINEKGEKWYINTINDSYDFDDYLKLSINPEGELCYYLGKLDNTNNSIKIKLNLKSKNNQIEKFVRLKKCDSASSYSYNDKYSYEHDEEKGIPIVTMRRMHDFDSKDKSIELFSKSAIELKNKPAIILDIRGNYGGQSIGALNWFKNFIGEMPQIESESIQLCSLINNYITQMAIKNIDYDKLTTELKDEYNKELKRSNSNSNKWYISKTEEKRHKNDTKIFVIVDDKVASTGEEFISYLKTLENIVVVGTNTSGSLLSNIYIRSQLPNSHINISFGNIITANKDFEEGKGFQPDVWIGNGDSLDRVLKLILKAPKI